ncbi:chloride channel [Vararia minispora EC-137]|uniref:Chloride channel n=1 Tax=Vararia minispora EC-137 TaxID=1314806 RepID=A0ACB8QEF0_9AGAM|nr:chloride channel [Vararia minispora EC-137]
MSEAEAPSGPLSGPSSTAWRRQRLLRIGSRSSIVPEEAPSPPSEPADETTPLVRPALVTHSASYGAAARPSFLARHNLPSLPSLRLPFKSRSSPPTPSLDRTASSFLRFTAPQRPISAYDASYQTSPTPAPAAQMNGIRVWYSSFSSIDWLHDAIKDADRLHRLRRRTSLRARLRTASDRLVGWLIVSLVGFLTALLACLIIRAEQWLFDVKEGYCTSAWFRPKRFCCPDAHAPDDPATPFRPATLVPGLLEGAAAPEICPAWREWGDVLAGAHASAITEEWAQYAAYTFLALLLAGLSAVLTIYLTASSSFTTRKDSGILSPDFAPSSETKTPRAALPEYGKRRVMYYASGSGIPEIKTILSGFVIHGYLGMRTMVTKAVGLALSVGSGLSLGKEGPFVHIASCIGNIVSRYFRKYETNEGKRREILSAASAAGVAVAFGAPIGGVLFSLEEVSYFFPPKVMWRSFFCAMIAAITLRFLDPFGTGKLVLFQVTYDKDWHAYELVPFLLLGVFGGVYGAYFSKLNYLWSREVRNKTWLKTHPIIEVLLVTLLTTVLCFLNPYTRMGGTELVAKLFSECKPGADHGLCVLDPPHQTLPAVRTIGTALLVKAFLTVITFGIRLPAGIFIPTLGVGACAGRIVGLLVQYAQHAAPDSPLFAACGGDLSCVIPGLYAMVGAAAALSGVTRTTVSLAVIMFELTDTLTYVVPVMLAVLVAKTVADAIESKGVYDLVIELAQLPYLEAKHQFVWGSLQVRDATDTDVDVIRLDRKNTVRTLRDQLLDLVNTGDNDAGFPVLRRDGPGQRMVGYIGANELEHALSIAADDADTAVQFSSGSSARGRLFRAGRSSASIVSAGDEDEDPFDFGVYMDQAPVTVALNSPLELVQQMFVKLGARYIVVVNAGGYYEGVIHKKAWLAFLSELEHKEP